MKRMSKFARRCAALMLAVVLLCMAVPAAFAAEGETLPAGATTMGGANTTLIPDEEENCLSWLFGSGDTITMPYLNVKGQGLRRNVTLDLEDCLVGITYTELGSIGQPNRRVYAVLICKRRKHQIRKFLADSYFSLR